MLELVSDKNSKSFKAKKYKFPSISDAPNDVRFGVYGCQDVGVKKVAAYK